MAILELPDGSFIDTEHFVLQSVRVTDMYDVGPRVIIDTPNDLAHFVIYFPTMEKAREWAREFLTEYTKGKQQRDCK
jgi:hypothetical protein